jgi:hypothetical protein
MSTLRLTGSTSGYTEVTAPAVAGSNTLVLPSSNGSAHQLLKNSGTAGTLEYGVTLPSGNGLAHQLVKNSSSAGTWEYGFTLPSGNGTADQALVTDGSGTLSFADRSRMVLETAKASTSGTEVDFTDIPSWVKRITVMFQGVSLTGSDSPLIQLGTSSGFVTSGYTGSSGTRSNETAFTAGIRLYGVTSSNTVELYALVPFENISGNDWVTSFTGGSPVGAPLFGGGGVSLSDTLTQIRVTRTGTNTFDNGSINIFYEG